MKFETLKHSDKRPSGLFELLLVGGFILGLTWVLHWLYLNFLYLYKVDIAEMIGSLPFVWLLGHVVSQSLSDDGAKQCGCEYVYRYFWTEWLHKRKCLAHTLNN